MIHQGISQLTQSLNCLIQHESTHKPSRLRNVGRDIFDDPVLLGRVSVERRHGVGSRSRADKLSSEQVRLSEKSEQQQSLSRSYSGGEDSRSGKG